MSLPNIHSDESKEESSSRAAISRPSGRARVKSTDIGLTPHARKLTEQQELVKLALKKEQNNSLLSYTKLPAPPAIEAVRVQAQVKEGRRKLLETQQLQQPSSSDGSNSARTTPKTGRRAAQAPAQQSQPHSARASRRGSGALAVKRIEQHAEEEKVAASGSGGSNVSLASQQNALPAWSRPEWLGPYPMPQPPKEAMVDPLLAPHGAPLDPSHTHAAGSQVYSPSKRHPHELRMPASNSFQYYRPLSPPKRHQCEGGPTSHLRHYLYAHREQQQDRNVSPYAKGDPAGTAPMPGSLPHSQGLPMNTTFLTASGSPLPLLSPVGSTKSLAGHQHQHANSHAQVPSPHATGEISPEAWSSWPFVNPRLVREEKKEGEEGKKDDNVDAQQAGNTAAPPALPVPRLFSSVVTEHERTLVFEYLRSTYSQLFQWPPEMREKQAKYLKDQARGVLGVSPTSHETSGEANDPESNAQSASSSGSSHPPLPTVLFTDATLDLLLEESRTAAGAIVLLRRLDAELALAIAKGTLGHPPSKILGEEEEKKNEPDQPSAAAEPTGSTDVTVVVPSAAVPSATVASSPSPPDTVSQSPSASVSASGSGSPSLAASRANLGLNLMVPGLTLPGYQGTVSGAVSRDGSAASLYLSLGNAGLGNSSGTSFGGASNSVLSPAQSQAWLAPSGVVSYSTLPPGPPPPPVQLPERSPVKFFESAEELVVAVKETRLFTECWRRKIFQWFLHPSPSNSNSTNNEPTYTISLFARSPGTIFLTYQMVDSLVTLAAKAGLAEESLFGLLQQFDQQAKSDPFTYAFSSFPELEQRVQSECVQRMQQVLQPHVASAIQMREQQKIEKEQQALIAAQVMQNEQLELANANSLNEPSPALLRHAAHSQAYARLVLFKFLRDGAGAGLFAEATDVAATVQEMDLLLDATSGLTLGQNYQTKWWLTSVSNGAALSPPASPIPPATAAPTGRSVSSSSRPVTSDAVGRAASLSRPMSSDPSASPAGGRRTSFVQSLPLPVERQSSRPITPSVSVNQDAHPNVLSPTSRTTTRPGTPDQAEKQQQSTEPSITPAPGAAPSVAASTRAYGSFLAARAIRVLRSLAFHGYTAFTRFEDLITACEIHTRKLHAERVKVYEFLTGMGAGTNNAKSPRGQAANRGQRFLQDQQSIAFTQQLDQSSGSNASASVGLFNAYYTEVQRRAKAREEAALQRAQQLKQNTHQFGTTHLKDGGESKLQAFQVALHAQANPIIPAAPSSSSAGTTTGGGPPRDRFRGQKSALYRSVPGHHKRNPSWSAELAKGGGGTTTTTQRKAATPITSTVPSHIVAAVAQHSPKEVDKHKFFDWGLQVNGPPGDSQPPQKSPSQSNMSRYASAKTLPPTASRSVLLKHADPSLELHPLGSLSSHGGTVTDESLPPMLVTPEHVDALFGSFEHLLQVPRLDSSNDPVSPTSQLLIPTSSPSGVAPAVSKVFDPLLEQDDEDYLLEEEQEEAWNSMDLTLLLQAYKQERPKELEQLERQPSYLAQHPLYKPMLDQLTREQQLHQQMQQQMMMQQMHEEQLYDPSNESRTEAYHMDEGDVDSELPSQQQASHFPGVAQEVVQHMSAQPQPPVQPPVQAQSSYPPVVATTLVQQSQVVTVIAPPSHAAKRPSIAHVKLDGASPVPANVAPSTALPVVEMKEQSAAQSKSAPPADATEPQQPIVTITPASEETDLAQSSPTTTQTTTDAPPPVADESHPTRVVITAATSVPGTSAAPVQPVTTAENQTEAPIPATAQAPTAAPTTAPTAASSSKPSTTANPSPSFASAAEEFALDTSNDLIILDPNADFERWNALGTDQPAAAEEESRPQTAASAVEEPALPVPKMLPVVWQTMQLLREQGKIKLHSGPSAPTASASAPPTGPVTGPAGPGTGTGLAPFIPNSGAVIPGGSMGSMKTLVILRELSRSGRGFFSMHDLIQTVCSMRSERKWNRRVQEKEKRKLIAAGITIATPSGLPNDLSSGGSATLKRRATKTTAGITSSPISSAQFAILSHDGFSRQARQIHVVDEEPSSMHSVGNTGGSSVMTMQPGQVGSSSHHALSSASSESFLSPTEFPSTIHPLGDEPPRQVKVPGRHGMAVKDELSPSSGGGVQPAEEDIQGRAWCRARLLTHLSTLLLFQGSHRVSDTKSPSSETGPPRHDVVVRMGDLESLLDALSAGPKDAVMLSEKLARKERDALAKESQLHSVAGALAKQTLRDLPPLGHSLAPLLSVLTWLDGQEVLFHSMSDLVRCIATGEWAMEYKQVERVRQQRRASQHEFDLQQLNQNARHEAEKLQMEV